MLSLTSRLSSGHVDLTAPAPRLFTFALLSYKRMSVIKGESYSGDLTDVSGCLYCHSVCLINQRQTDG